VVEQYCVILFGVVISVKHLVEAINVQAVAVEVG
jgi:hypothetical protein